MAEMYIRICDKEDDQIYPCDGFNEKKKCLIIERPGKPVMVLQRKDLVSPTKVYLMSSTGQTIDSRVYRAEDLAEESKD